MKLLHVLKSKPDSNTEALMEILSQGEDPTTFELFHEQADYETLIDLVFGHEKIISWW